jgi:L-iditol 2-dehydrogenase
MSHLLAYTRTTERSSGTKSILPSGYTSMSGPCFLSLYEYELIRSYRLPEAVSWGEAALLEPLSVVLHGVRTAGLSLGRPALICGAGPIGLIALAAARASGAFPIVVTDLEPNCITYQMDLSLGSEDNAKKIRQLFGHDEYSMPSAVLECTGVEGSLITGIFTVRRGGVVCVIGVGRSIMNNLPFMHISLAEVCLSLLLVKYGADIGVIVD